jgi:hypothetical protein
MHYTWTCHCCGKQHTELPLAMGHDSPDPWLGLTEAERQGRGAISSDTCIIDGKHFFVRGCLEIPLNGQSGIFNWSVWVSVSEKSFKRIIDLWETDVRDTEPPFFGWLSNSLPTYPETFPLKTNLYLRNHGTRPYIDLEPTEHPLAREQREGISLQRVAEIVAACGTH